MRRPFSRRVLYIRIYINIVIRCYCNITRIVYIIIMYIIIICINDCAAKCVFIAAAAAGSEQNAFVANAHLTYSYINIVVHCIVFGKSGNTFMYSVPTRIPVLDNMLMCNTQYTMHYTYIYIYIYIYLSLRNMHWKLCNCASYISTPVDYYARPWEITTFCFSLFKMFYL